MTRGKAEIMLVRKHVLSGGEFSGGVDRKGGEGVINNRDCVHSFCGGVYSCELFDRGITGRSECTIERKKRGNLATGPVGIKH